MSFVNSFIREFFDLDSGGSVPPTPMPMMATRISSSHHNLFSATTRRGATPDLLASSFNSVTSTRSDGSASRRLDSFHLVSSQGAGGAAGQRRLQFHDDRSRRRSEDHGYPRVAPAKVEVPISHKRSSSVSESTAWKNSLRSDLYEMPLPPTIERPEKPERLLPSLPKSAGEREWRPFERVMARSRNRAHDPNFGAKSHPQPEHRYQARKDSLGKKYCKSASKPEVREERRKKASKTSKDDLAKFTQEHGLDQALTDEIMREVVTKDPGIKWKDIAGLNEAKSLLQEAVVLPLVMPDFFHGIRRPWKGILMIGPPGTGKTLLAKAVATECKTTFFNVSSSSLTSKFRGESEKIVKHLFKIAEFHAPSIIFIDEVDALCSQRGSDSEHEASKRFKAELLMLMDGLNSGISGAPKKKERRDSRGLDDSREFSDEDEEEPLGEKMVMVLAATNHPWLIDEAFRRRFEKRILIDLPDEASRLSLLQLCLQNMELDSSVNLGELAAALEAYSGADISTVCRDAAMMSLRRAIRERALDLDALRALSKDEVDKPISGEDLKDAAHRCKRACSESERKKYQEWMEKFGSE